MHHPWPPNLINTTSTPKSGLSLCAVIGRYCSIACSGYIIIQTSHYTVQMNALECRTLTTACVHDSHMYTMAVYCSLQISAWSKSRGKAPGYATLWVGLNMTTIPLCWFCKYMYTSRMYTFSQTTLTSEHREDSDGQTGGQKSPSNPPPTLYNAS